MNIKDKTLQNHYYVCSQHFTKFDYLKILSDFNEIRKPKVLKSGVIPGKNIYGKIYSNLSSNL